MRDAHPLNKEEHRDSRGGKRTRLALYPEHLPEAELLAGVRGGRRVGGIGDGGYVRC